MTRDEMKEWAMICELIDKLTDVPVAHPPEVVEAAKKVRSMFDGSRELWKRVVPMLDYLDPPAPTWQAPASLADGMYSWNGKQFFPDSEPLILLAGQGVIVTIFRDFTDPPRIGRWRVESGVGTWIGE